MRQYMKEKRTNRQFREKENKKKQQKRKENIEKSRECQRRPTKTFKIANPVKSNKWRKKKKQKDRNVIQIKLESANNNVF